MLLTAAKMHKTTAHLILHTEYHCLQTVRYTANVRTDGAHIKVFNVMRACCLHYRQQAAADVHV